VKFTDGYYYYYYYYYYVNKNHIKRVIYNEYKSENKNWYEI